MTDPTEDPNAVKEQTADGAQVIEGVDPHISQSTMPHPGLG